MAAAYIYILRHQGSLLVTLLSIRPLLYLGGVSYGFYLYHNFVRLHLLFDAIGVHPDIPNKARVAIEFAATLMIASASWVFIERPILKWARSARVVAGTTTNDLPNMS
jgi:peptidoglycan/LPS O-acetylase OafA/YrhL